MFLNLYEEFQKLEIIHKNASFYKFGNSFKNSSVDCATGKEGLIAATI